MAQPTPYTRTTNFTDYSTSNPSNPQQGTSLDAEFNDIKTTTDQIRANLALLQRDDGDLKNASVHTEALSNAVLTLIKATANGYNVKGSWAASTDYAVGDLVDFSQATYLCFDAHTSGSTFSANSSKFILLANAAITSTASAVDTFNGDGSQTQFTLSNNAPSDGGVTEVLVFVNGQLRTPTTQYTISSNVITFGTAPSSGTGNVIVWGTSTVVEAAKTAAQTARDTAETYRNTSQDHRDTSESYAVETGGVVKHFSGASNGTSGTGADQTGVYSAKEHAVGTSVDTGSAKDWASKSTTQVASTDYSAKEYAVGSATASSKGFSNTAEDTQVPGGASSDRSALHYREKAKDFATKTSGQVTGDTGTADQGYSAKEWAQGTQTRGAAAGGSAKDWATYTSGTVDNSEYSAKYYATQAQQHAANAATSFDNFDDRYLGTNSSNPTNDNDGNALVTGALYFNTSDGEMRVYDGSSWIPASAAQNATILEYVYDITGSVTSIVGASGTGFAENNGAAVAFGSTESVHVYLNGVQLVEGASDDYQLTPSTNTVTFNSAVVSGDIVKIVVYKTFTVGDAVPASTGGTFSGNVAINSAKLEVTQPASDQSGGAAIKAIGTAYQTNKAFHAYMNTSNASKSLIYAENGSGGVFNVAGDGNVDFSNTSDAIVTIKSDEANSASNTDVQLKLRLNGADKYTIGVDDDDSDKLKVFNGGGFGGSGITMDSSGNVAIGRTTPYTSNGSDAELSVNGTTKGNRFDVGHGTISQTSSGAMTIIGHNALSNPSVNNSVISHNTNWHSHFMRMYYDQGISFHTSPSTISSTGTEVYNITNTTTQNNERLRITTSGNIHVQTGNVVIGTAGKGIDFSNQTGTSNPDSGGEVLSHYEEGTFTATLGYGPNTITTATGTYTKIGNVCTLGVTFGALTNSSTSGGSPYISGLPFSNGAYTPSSSVWSYNFFSGTTPIHAVGFSASNSVSFLLDGSFSNATMVNLSSSYVAIGMTYITA